MMMLTKNGGGIVEGSAIRNGRSKSSIIVVMSLENAPAIFVRYADTVSLVCSDSHRPSGLLLTID
jgi:hypothetical protein